MRVSLVARFVSHPTIDFGTERHSLSRARLGLDRLRIEYHRPRRSGMSIASVSDLRSQTSRFSFPAVTRAARLPTRNPALPYGLPRVRRA